MAFDALLSWGGVELVIGKSYFSTCADGCLRQLKAFLLNYTGTEQPTHEILRSAYANGEDLPSNLNVFASYYGRLELAIDEAVVSLEREYPDWTPSWRKVDVKVARVRYAVTGTKPMASYLNHNVKVKGVEQVGKKQKVHQPSTEDEQCLLNVLVDMYRDNGYNLPSWRQITKNSLISESELLRVLGKGHGRDGVMKALKKEIAYRKYHVIGSNDELQESHEKQSSKEKVKESTAEVATEAEKVIISEVTSEMVPMEPSAIVKSESVDEPVVTTTTMSTVAESTTSSNPTTEVEPVTPPKRRGKTRSSYDEELKKLVYYYELLGGKVPGQYDLQKLAKLHPGEIRGYMTLVRYLGPQTGWAELIRDYLAKQLEESS